MPRKRSKPIQHACILCDFKHRNTRSDFCFLCENDILWAATLEVTRRGRLAAFAELMRRAHPESQPWPPSSKPHSQPMR
jgi:hypothetical protein